MVPLGVFKSVWRDQAGGREPGSTAQDRIRLCSLSTTKPHGLTGKGTAAGRTDDGVGTLMVPRASGCRGIGAKVSSSQGKLSISLMVTDKEEKHDEGEINNTTGKTRIGNSYYEWSMNYPSWMIVGEERTTRAVRFQRCYGPLLS